MTATRGVVGDNGVSHKFPARTGAAQNATASLQHAVSAWGREQNLLDGDAWDVAGTLTRHWTYVRTYSTPRPTKSRQKTATHELPVSGITLNCCGGVPTLIDTT